ncbi:DNA ligase 1, partial [Blastocystis sp. ATCC 50177/Nand II]
CDGQSIPEGVTTCILDSECVAWDREQNKILPFQVLSTRARKDVKEEDVKIHVVIFMFDILFLNGESVIQRPLKERRALLRSTIHEVPGRMQFATSRELADTEEIQEFLMESVNAGCEGLMVKTLTENATYEPSKRSLNWLKLKKDYLQDLGDSLDLVPIGGYYGKGKRTGNFGAFLLACYDVNSEEFQSVCKLGTGFSDEALHAHSAFFSGENVVEKKPVDYNVVPSMEPDVWFKPVQVWEVRAADLSISPVHTAAIGIVDAEKGIALRFPRFVRIREDKSAEEATSAEQVADFYNSQKIVNL